MSHPHIKTKLFLCDSAGRMISRRPDVWSSVSDKCVDCGTTERPHEAKGRCQLCYVKWKRATDPAWKERTNRRAKIYALKTDSRERYDAARKDNPKRKAQRQVICKRYNDKVSKWPRGSTVFYLAVPGFEPIRGTIMDKTNTRALVKFATYFEWIPFARLMKDGAA